ncbi:hypothetical protein QE320_gp131 [Pseudomonas phage EM]|uniref:Uncharacterized protein n=1 Tax=Pseudomonas phage EM TaxID=2936914 RepID=A0AAE9HIA1_9CAUD|nr:hypothetical protein QE320_gp131 [Pseudomonas phage EM]UPW35923.1 hypothetical protein EM_138 [Pseudomonas phage EM]
MSSKIDNPTTDIVPGTIVKLTHQGALVTLGWPESARYVGAFALAVEGWKVGSKRDVVFISLHDSTPRDANSGLGVGQVLFNSDFEVVAVPGKKYFVKREGEDRIGHYFDTSEPVTYLGFDTTFLSSHFESVFGALFRGKTTLGNPDAKQTIYADSILSEFVEEQVEEKTEKAESSENKKVEKPVVLGYAVVGLRGNVLEIVHTREAARREKRWYGGKAMGAKIVKLIEGEEVR